MEAVKLQHKKVAMNHREKESFKKSCVYADEIWQQI